MNDWTDEGYSGVMDVRENSPHQSSPLLLKLQFPQLECFYLIECVEEVQSGGPQPAGS